MQEILERVDATLALRRMAALLRWGVSFPENIELAANAATGAATREMLKEMIRSFNESLDILPALAEPSFPLDGCAYWITAAGWVGGLLDTFWEKASDLLALGLEWRPEQDQVRKRHRELYFALTRLEIMLACGVQILTALETVRAQCAEPELAKGIEKAIASVSAGTTLADPVFWPGLDLASAGALREGEETGALDSALHKAAAGISAAFGPWPLPEIPDSEIRSLPEDAVEREILKQAELLGDADSGRRTIAELKRFHARLQRACSSLVREPTAR